MILTLSLARPAKELIDILMGAEAADYHKVKVVIQSTFNIAEDIYCRWLRDLVRAKEMYLWIWRQKVKVTPLIET